MASVPVVSVIPSTAVTTTTTPTTVTFNYELKPQSNFIGLTSIPSIVLIMEKTSLFVSLEFRIQDSEMPIFYTSSRFEPVAFSNAQVRLPYTFTFRALTPQTVLFTIIKALYEGQTKVGEIVYNFVAYVTPSIVTLDPIIEGNSTVARPSSGVEFFVIPVGNIGVSS